MKKLVVTLGALLALAFGSNGWGQDVFTKYGPQPGIQKSTGLDYHNTAAVAADVVSLWSGTCTAGNFLQGTGVCAVPVGVAPSGAANLVYATPNGSSGSATLRALVGADVAPINLGSTANGGVLSTSILLGTNGGTSNGFFSVTGPTTALRTFTFPNASATVLTSNAAVTVAQGGTGVATLTGLVKGNGTSAFTAAASSDVIALWTGTCSSTTFLRGDGSCQSPGGSGTPGGATTNIQFNNAGAFGGDSGFTYAGSGGLITQTGALNSIETMATQNSSAGTAAAAQYQAINNASHASYVGIQGSGNTGSVWTSGPTGEQVYYGGSGNIPVVFASNSVYRGQIKGDGSWRFVSGAAANTEPQIDGTTTGTTSRAFMSFGDSTQARNGYVGVTGADSGSMFLETDTNNINLLPLATTGKIQGSYDGGATFGSVPIGARRIIWGAITANGSGCTVIASGNLSGACTRTATGNYSIGSVGPTNNMGCTASPTFTPSNAARSAGISGATSSITVAIYNGSGTAVDDNFQFSCMTQ